MNEDVPITVIKDNMLPRIQKIQISEHTGYAAWHGKKGYFVHRHAGEAYGKPFLKIRIVEIYRGQNGIELQWRKLKGGEEKRTLSNQVNVGILPELAQAVATMLVMVLQDMGMKPGTVDIEPQVQRESELDDLAKKFGGRI